MHDVKTLVKQSGLSFKDWYHTVYLNSEHWRQLREAKFAVSGRACQQCASTHKIQVHHLAYRAIFDVTVIDLLVVCGSCHERLHDGESSAPKAARMPKAPPSTPKPKQEPREPAAYVTPQGHMMSKKQRKKARRLEREQKAREKAEAKALRPKPNPPKTPLEKALRFTVERERVIPVQEGCGITMVTREMVEAIKTRRGAWTNDQLRHLGIPVMFNGGWLYKWTEPRAIPTADWEKAESITRRSAFP